MTYERSEEMLEKIHKVATDEMEQNEGIDYNIKVSANNREIIVDLIVYLITHSEDDPEEMNVSYATCKSVIRDASREQLEKTCELMHNCIKNSTGRLRMPDHEEQLAAIQQRLEEEGMQQLLNLMPNFE